MPLLGAAPQACARTSISRHGRARSVGQTDLGTTTDAVDVGTTE